MESASWKPELIANSRTQKVSIKLNLRIWLKREWTSFCSLGHTGWGHTFLTRRRLDKKFKVVEQAPIIEHSVFNTRSSPSDERSLRASRNPDASSLLETPYHAASHMVALKNGLFLWIASNAARQTVGSKRAFELIEPCLLRWVTMTTKCELFNSWLQKHFNTPDFDACHTRTGVRCAH